MADTWNHFYMQTTGSDLNAGSTTDDAAVFTYAAGTFVRATGIFTVAGGNPQTDGVTTDMWASVYTTSGAATTKYVAKITARDATTITTDYTTLKLGQTATVSESAGAATCKVGGAWASPAVLDYIYPSSTSTMNSCINIKAGTYANTTNTRSIVITGTTLLPVWLRGYKTTKGDMDVAGGTRAAGTDIPLITFTTGRLVISGAHITLSNIDITGAYVASASSQVRATGGNLKLIRCRIENTSASANSYAFSCATTGPMYLIGCRLKADVAATYVARCDVATSFLGCHVIGGLTSISTTSGIHVVNSVIESFITNGIEVPGVNSHAVIQGNSIYSGEASSVGVLISGLPTAGMCLVSNNIIGCVTGIGNAGTGTNGVVPFRNHFYGATNNMTGLTELAAYNDPLGVASLLIDDDTDPWVDKATNDFTLAAAAVDKSAGFPGVFEGQTKMTGYPDIGAVRHIDPTAGGGAVGDSGRGMWRGMGKM